MQKGLWKEIYGSYQCIEKHKFIHLWGIKKASLKAGFALQVGLEPTTYGLTVRRSNQLSY